MGIIDDGKETLLTMLLVLAVLAGLSLGCLEYIRWRDPCQLCSRPYIRKYTVKVDGWDCRVCRECASGLCSPHGR